MPGVSVLAKPWCLFQYFMLILINIYYIDLHKDIFFFPRVVGLFLLIFFLVLDNILPRVKLYYFALYS
jgi:hypothetical protein